MPLNAQHVILRHPRSTTMIALPNVPLKLLMIPTYAKSVTSLVNNALDRILTIAQLVQSKNSSTETNVWIFALIKHSKIVINARNVIRAVKVAMAQLQKIVCLALIQIKALIKMDNANVNWDIFLIIMAAVKNVILNVCLVQGQIVICA